MEKQEILNRFFESLKREIRLNSSGPNYSRALEVCRLVFDQMKTKTPAKAWEGVNTAIEERQKAFKSNVMTWEKWIWRQCQK